MSLKINTLTDWILRFYDFPVDLSSQPALVLTRIPSSTTLHESLS